VQANEMGCAKARAGCGALLGDVVRPNLCVEGATYGDGVCAGSTPYLTFARKNNARSGFRRDERSVRVDGSTFEGSGHGEKAPTPHYYGGLALIDGTVSSVENRQALGPLDAPE
jgi:hypothetical protein